MTLWEANSWPLWWHFTIRSMQATLTHRTETTVAKCLHCGETPESIRRKRIVVCGIMEGYETPELSVEFPRHRWVDWRDSELTRFGVKPDAFEKHRRTPVTTFQWIDCKDTVRGHHPADENDVGVMADRVGQCIFCGKIPASADSGSE